MAELAERLWEARKNGNVVQPHDISEPATTEEAYAIQTQIARLSGYEVRGFKGRLHKQRGTAASRHFGTGPDLFLRRIST